MPAVVFFHLIPVGVSMSFWLPPAKWWCSPRSQNYSSPPSPPSPSPVVYPKVVAIVTFCFAIAEHVAVNIGQHVAEHVAKHVA